MFRKEMKTFEKELAIFNSEELEPFEKEIL
jgi:hypothetical protein